MVPINFTARFIEAPWEEGKEQENGVVELLLNGFCVLALPSNYRDTYAITEQEICEEAIAVFIEALQQLTV